MEDYLLNAVKDQDKENFLSILPEHVHELKASPHILHMVCRYGWLDVAKVLINDYSMSPNIANNIPSGVVCKATCLHFACISGNTELVEYLIQFGCNVYTITSDGLSVADCAVMGGLSIVECLVKHHVTADFLDNVPSKMKCAYENWDNDLIKYLIVERKCNIIIDYHTGDTILHWVCRDGYIERLEYLVNECQCDVHVKNHYGDTLLHTLCQLSYNESSTLCSILRFLIERLQHPYIQDNLSFVECAIKSGWQIEGIKMICLNVQGYEMYSNKLEFTSRILLMAYHYWNESIVKFFLVNMQYSPIISIKTGDTVLHEACKEMRLDKLKFLAEHCNVPYPSDPNTNTLLHAFSSSSVYPSTELLSFLKPKCNYSKNANDVTPLECAIVQGGSSSDNTLLIVRCLVEAYGTDELYTSHILELVSKYGSNDLMKYLLVEMKYYLQLHANDITSVCGKWVYNGIGDQPAMKLEYLINECQVHIHDSIEGSTICYTHPENNNSYRQCSSSQEVGVATMSGFVSLLNSAILHKSLNAITFFFEKYNLNPQKDVMLDFSETLTIAYTDWEESVIKYLLDKANSANILPLIDKISGDTILHKACQAENINHVKYLVEVCDCDPHVANHNDEGPVHFAIACQNFPILKYFCINCNCCPDLSSDLNGTYMAMTLAIFKKMNGFDVLQHLVEKCKVNINEDIISFAYQNWCPDIVKYLIGGSTNKVDPQVQNTLVDKILKLSVTDQNVERLQYLIDNFHIHCNSSPYMRKNGETLIHIACSRCDREPRIDFEFLQYLCIDYTYCPDLSGDQEVGTLTMISAITQKEKGLPVVQHLVEKCSVEGNNQIMSAAYKHWSPTIVRYLIVEAKFYVYTTANYTILHMSAKDQDQEKLEYLINTCGCSFHVKIDDGKSLMFAACNSSLIHFDFLQYLCINCNCCPDLSSNAVSCASQTIKSAILKKKDGLIVLRHLIEKCKVEISEHISFFIYLNWCPDVVKYLIVESKVELTVRSKLVNKILQLIAIDKNLERLQYLVEDCGSLHIINSDCMIQVITNYHHAQIDFDILHYLCINCDCCPDLSGDQEVGTKAIKSAIAQKERGLAIIKHLVEKCKVTGSYKITLAVYENWCTKIVKYLFAEMRLDLFVSREYADTILQLNSDDEKYFKFLKKFLLEIHDFLMTDNAMATFIIQYIPLHTHNETISYALRFLFIECKYVIVTNHKTIIRLLLYCYDTDEADTLLTDVAHHLICTSVSEKNTILLQLVQSDYVNHCCYSSGFISLIDHLISDDQCDLSSEDLIGNTVLHLACRNFSGDQSLIERIMSTGKVDPLRTNRFSQTPLMLFKTDDSNHLKQIEKVISRFGEVQIHHPIHEYVSIIFLGNPGVGKSTLAKVIKDRNKYSPIIAQFRNVQGVELHTAGIIPSILNDKDLGRIILHDLAGQAEYYSSHTAVLESLLQGSAAVFVLVVSLADKNMKSFHQWLNIIENVSHNALHKCELVVVASHADQSSVRARVNLDELKKCIADSNPANNSLSKVFVNDGLFVLDCRKLGGTQFVKFISTLSTACKSIASACSTKEMSLYCHMLYDFFQRDGKSVYTLQELIETNTQDTGLFLPKEISQVDTIISKLSTTGLIVYLCNALDLGKSCIVADKEMLLSHLNGVLFAPSSFKQHVDIASNIGVVKLSDLQSIFPQYDPEILLQFLQYMELCNIINTKFIHELQDNSSQCSAMTSIDSELIFIPALIKCIERPAKITEISFKFGWCLCCSGNHFFLSRFLHLFQLRLSCMFSDPKSNNTFERYCKVWTKGIYWKDTKGVEALVEVADSNQALIVLTSCEDGAKVAMLNLIYHVLAEILSCKQQVMPQVVTDEYIIDSSSLHSSLTSLTDIPLYKVHLLAHCYINKRPYILDDELNVVPISKLIAEETCNKENIYTAVFAGRNPQDILNMKGAPIEVKRGRHSQVIISSGVEAFVENNPCSQILKSHTPKILELMDPLKFANDLSSVSLLTDETLDKVITSLGLSRYEKASYIMNDVNRHLRAFNAEERIKEVETFTTFCKVLKDQHVDSLTEISKEMMDHVEHL